MSEYNEEEYLQALRRIMTTTDDANQVQYANGLIRAVYNERNLQEEERVEAELKLDTPEARYVNKKLKEYENVRRGFANGTLSVQEHVATGTTHAQLTGESK